MTVTAGVGHYWLGTNCPHESDPYTWTDKSRTDYFGPNKGLTFIPTSNAREIPTFYGILRTHLALIDWICEPYKSGNFEIFSMMIEQEINSELLSCKKGNGFHMHGEGFVLFALVDDPTSSTEQFSAAPALCSYPMTFYTTVQPETTVAMG